ncbi:MAG: hypothetical protein M9928_15475 [Anaerolineae bacterium]|nr:hypothetical protein [Anaerolineae bacterium]MCO5194587.1 hypothetical protein [Anaerolineae bacterium]MCO5199212.1 hypothetical protein [Anaerolineae bacterium]MCO5206436.1 hypothetical protein [Anaerolineae bacterium]
MSEHVSDRAALGIIQYPARVMAEWRPVIGQAAMDVYQFYILLWDRRHDTPPLKEIDIYSFLGIHSRTLSDARLILQWCGLIRAREFGRHTRYVITTPPVLDDEMAALALERMRIDEKEGAVKWPATCRRFENRLANRISFGQMVKSEYAPTNELRQILTSMGITGGNLDKCLERQHALALVWAHWWVATPDKAKPSGYLWTMLDKEHPARPGHVALAQWWLDADAPERALLNKFASGSLAELSGLDNDMQNAARDIWHRRGTFELEPVREAQNKQLGGAV